MTALPPLQAEAERLSRAVRPGSSGRRSMGRGGNYWMYRAYQGGEPATIIDWRQSASVDKLYVREREKEITPLVYLWADNNPSMSGAAEGMPSKTERARLLLLALAHVLLRDDVSVALLDDPRRKTTGATGFNALVERMLLTPPVGRPPLSPLARHARLVICSDFLSDMEEWIGLIRSCASADRHGVLLHLVNPSEKESIPTHMVRDQLKPLAKNIGWEYLRHATSDSPSTALSLLHDHLAGDLR